jgi:hypothetical protein
MFIPPNLGKFEVTKIQENTITILAESKKIDHQFRGDMWSLGGDRCFYTFPYRYFWGKDYKRSLRAAERLQSKGKTSELQRRYNVSTVQELESLYKAAVIAGLRNKKS